MIPKLLLNTQIIWMIFRKILNTIQIKNENFNCFWCLIADMLSNTKLNPIVTELLIRGWKLIISLVFITQSFYTIFNFAVAKNIRINSIHYFILKIPNKPELQQIAFHHSSDIDLKNFINLYKKCTAKPYSFLVTCVTFASDNPLRFRKNILERI